MALEEAYFSARQVEERVIRLSPWKPITTKSSDIEHIIKQQPQHSDEENYYSKYRGGGLNWAETKIGTRSTKG